MAGAGYKLFNTGDVLTAAQVNTYLQEQAVMRFANAAARTTALSGVLAEGMMSYLDDTNSVEVYNGSAWVSVGSTGDITAVTTAANSGLTGGATSGDVALRINTTAKGSIIAGSGASTLAELTVGANNTVLTADSSTATGLKWATAGGGDVVKTGSTTFSNVASFSMDNVFSSTYGLYIVRITITNATAGSFGTFRYRASGTATTSNYFWNNSKINMATSPTQTLAGAIYASSIRIDQTNTDTTSNRASLVYMKLFNPNATDKGKAMTWENQQGANQNWWSGSGYLYDSTTQFDGFDFTQDSGNITGKAEVYGYKL